MDNKEDINELLEKEKEYNDLYEDFLKSDNDKKFSKIEVEKIIEAHIFKEVLGKYNNNDDKKAMRKNILVTSKEIGSNIFNTKFLLSFFLSTIFYIGFLLLISYFLYSDLFVNKISVFIVALAFSIVDKFIKPLIFIADLISFTFHKIGLLTLTIYTLVFYFLTNMINEKVSLEKSILISVIVLILMFIIDYIKRDSIFKTRLLDDLDETGSEDDE